MSYIQEPPFAAQIEFSEGCNLRCPFCGINGIRDSKRTYKFMNQKTVESLASAFKKAKWTSRLEFAMHGEPTQNPDILKYIQIFREALPKNYFLIETNGSGFLGKTSEEVTQKVLSFFEAGLDTVALDEYQNVPWGNAVRTKLIQQELQDRNIKFYEYPRDKEGSPHTRTKEKRFVIIAPIDLSKSGTHAELNNHCGLGAPMDASAMHDRCAKPFREISVRWDGSVAICCNDWSGAFRIGNVNETPIYKLWQHPRFMAARQKLLHRQRDFKPCLGCNNRSYRPGLLPDKFGKETLPVPDIRIEKLLQEAISEGSFTEVIERSWTKDDLVQIERTKPKRLI